MAVAGYQPRGTRTARKVWSRWWAGFEQVGHIVHFAGQALLGTVHAMRVYRREVANKFTEMTWGSGAIVVGGGVAAVMVVLGISVGAMIAILGFNLLGQLSVGPVAGLLTSFAVTRELGPIIAGIGFAIQAGCRITAETGAMRISEEIDALEAQAIRPIPYVVSTRVIAATAAIVPIYVVALALCYYSAKFGLTVIFGQPSGAYQHYFDLFINPTDVVYSLIKVVILVIAITILHAYYGFYASGGPAGVGEAAGRALRASIVATVVIDMSLTLLMWGLSSSIAFSG